MKVVMAMFVLLLLPVTGAVAGVFPLPNGGQLELFPVGHWKVASEDVGEVKIIFVPQDPKINARAIYGIASEGSDDFPTAESLAEHMMKVAERLIAAGDFVERRPVIKPFYPGQGFGCYAVMTDRKLVGRPTPPGEYRIFSIGMIRLEPSVYLKVQIMADSEEAAAYQQLLGMAEGAVYTRR